jgi:hypothetical protein
MNNRVNYEGYAIYKRIANKYFDKLVRDIRSKFKAHLITTKETIPMIRKMQKWQIEFTDLPAINHQRFHRFFTGKNLWGLKYPCTPVPKCSPKNTV